MTKETFIKRKHLTGALPTVQRFSPLSSWQGAWQHAGRRGAGEIAECYRERERETKTDTEKDRQTDRDRLGLSWAFETLKPIPSDTLPPTSPHLLILLILSNSSIPW